MLHTRRQLGGFAAGPGLVPEGNGAPDGSFLIIRGERSGEVSFHLHNLNWWAVGEAKPKPLGIRFDAGLSLPINAVGTDGNADIGGGVWFVTDARFRRELAQANRIRVYLNGGKLSALPLRGSGRALTELSACVENLREQLWGSTRIRSSRSMC